jgi:hypothetical protein
MSNEKDPKKQPEPKKEKELLPEDLEHVSGGLCPVAVERPPTALKIDGITGG